MRRAAAIAAAVLALGACGSDAEPTGERATDPGFVPATTTTTTLPEQVSTGDMFGDITLNGEPVDGGGIAPEAVKVVLPGLRDGLAFCVGDVQYLAFELDGYTRGVGAAGVLNPEWCRR